LQAEDAVEIDFSVMLEEDERSDDDEDVEGGRDSTVAIRDALALDGKTLRGARLDDGRKVHFVSVLTHKEKVTIAQRNVEAKTNEITAFRPLLEGLELTDVVVTADAMHTQGERAAFLAGRGAHFIFGLKDNQPTLAKEAARLLAASPVVYETRDRAHGPMEHRYYSVASVPNKLAASLGFPSASQVVKVYRERCDLGDHLESEETSYYVTDLSQEEASPEELAHHIGGHWRIENSSHYVRSPGAGLAVASCGAGATRMAFSC